MKRLGKAVALTHLLLVGAIVAPGGAAAQTQRTNQCVACHQTLPERSQAGHSFASWRQSRHAVAGIGCDACHGGDASAADTARAHRPMVRSTERSSPLFYTQIPMTCGRCHAAELGYFRSSMHFARLRSDGRGPNCITCHGAMATSVLTPEGVLATCSACHVPGGAAPEDKARESAPILSLVRAETMLYHVVATVAAGAPAARSRSAAAPLASAQRNLAAAAEVWHTFRLDTASARLSAARTDLGAAWSALGYRTSLEASLRSTPRSTRP
jgi:nitrate/TMAO reductase-like tetraheme cytochrome c subunit